MMKNDLVTISRKRSIKKIIIFDIIGALMFDVGLTQGLITSGGTETNFFKFLITLYPVVLFAIMLVSFATYICMVCVDDSESITNKKTKSNKK